MAFSRNSLVATVAGSLSLAVLTGCPSAPTQQPVGTPTPAAGASAPATTPSTAASTPTGTATATPGPVASGGSSAPTTPVSAPPASGKVVIVSGAVYDEGGATVEGAVVKVTSLDASVPYTASTNTSAGSYVVNNVPEGANVEIVISKDGWTSRRRVGSFQTSSTGQKNEVNFGGSNTNDAGVAYFISKYPEISSVEPKYDASNVDPGTVSYKLTLSEALDDVNRRRFEDAIRLFPANKDAAPESDSATTNAYDTANTPGLGADATYFNLKDQRVTFSAGGTLTKTLDRIVEPNGTYIVAPTTVTTNTPNHPQGPAGTTFTGNTTTQTSTVPPAMGNSAAPSSGLPWDYAIKKGSLFLDDSNTRATVTWNADNTQATLTFAAPLIADRTNNAKYQVGLVTTSTTEKIVDKDNNQLGMNAAGSLQSYPTSLGALLHGTVRSADLSLITTTSPSANTRWIDTHQDAALFSVAVDVLDPKLVGVSYTKNLGASSRFEFTFNEPLSAYNGRTGGHVNANLRNGSILTTITFAVSDKAGGTKNVNLKGGSGIAVQGGVTVTAGAATAFVTGAIGASRNVENEFALVPTSSSTAPTGLLYTFGSPIATAESDVVATPGNKGKLLLTVDPRNPKTLFLYVVGNQNVFDSSIVELKTRVQGVADPAGNAIKSSDADLNQITGSV